MIVMTDVLETVETTAIMKNLAQTSLGKSFVSVVTDKGPIEIQFDGFASDIMVVGKTRDGLSVVMLLAPDAAEEKRSTIVLGKKQDG